VEEGAPPAGSSGRAVTAGFHIALRAGDGDATSDIRSLFHIGVVRDVFRVAGTTLAAAALGSTAREGFPYEGNMYLVEEDETIVPFVSAERAEARAGPSTVSRG